MVRYFSRPSSELGADLPVAEALKQRFGEPTVLGQLSRLMFEKPEETALSRVNVTHLIRPTVAVGYAQDVILPLQAGLDPPEGTSWQEVDEEGRGYGALCRREPDGTVGFHHVDLWPDGRLEPQRVYYVRRPGGFHPATAARLRSKVLEAGDRRTPRGTRRLGEFWAKHVAVVAYDPALALDRKSQEFETEVKRILGGMCLMALVQADLVPLELGAKLVPEG